MVEIKSFKSAWIAKCEDIYIKGDEVDGGDLFSKEIHGWDLTLDKHVDCTFFDGRD